MAMLERYEHVVSIPSSRTANFVNEIVDSIRTVAALGWQREAMRIYDSRRRPTPKRARYLAWAAGAFALGQAVILLTAALMFHWVARRLTQGAVGGNVGRNIATWQSHSSIYLPRLSHLRLQSLNLS